VGDEVGDPTSHPPKNIPQEWLPKMPPVFKGDILGKKWGIFLVGISWGIFPINQTKDLTEPDTFSHPTQGMG
jgi:hypothetical protein